MGDNKSFGGLAEESKLGDEFRIHPAPVQATDDTSDRTSAVLGQNLPMRHSSDSGKNLTGLCFASLSCQVKLWEPNSPIAIGL